MNRRSPVFLSCCVSSSRTGQSSRLVFGLLAILLVAGGCRRDADVDGKPPSQTSSPPVHQARQNELFTDRARETGLDFVYFNGMAGDFYFPEMMGGGVALFDYDNDGDLDVFFAQGQMLGSGKTAGQALFPPHSLPLRGRLFRNDLTVQADGTRQLHFTDVTEQSGINVTDYGMGAAAADFNNDGCVDLYLTSFGQNHLYRNNCDGTFTDVSNAAGVSDPGWSVSAAFVDYDRDGWLDLYVGHYVRYSLDIDQRCTGLTGRRDYCTPAVYIAQTDRLFHNERNGTFTDVTAKALVGGLFGPALGVSVADFNGDGWPDIYVANDGKPNLLWINQKNGTFKNMGLLSGAAVSADGKAGGSMGVDAGDVDNDGDEDLFMTQLPTEGSQLYVNDGSGLFEDRSNASGPGQATRGFTGFGTAWFDFDNDGWLDLFSANGSIEAQKARLGETFPYDERSLLFRNLGNGRLEDTSSLVSALQQPGVGRGAAFGDIDNDGDIDIVVSNINGPARLLINNVGNKHHWIGLRLLGCPSAPCRNERDMLGAKVQIVRQNGPALWRRARAEGSYASANDPRVVVGLGESTEPPTVRVFWPNGAMEEFPRVTIDRWTVLKQAERRMP